MKQLKLKSLLSEAKTSPAEKGLKALAKAPWKYAWDTAADHGYLENETAVDIFPPYDAVNDPGQFFDKPKDKKGNWMVQVRSADGRINKFFWYKTLPQALTAIKTEHMPKYTNYKNRR